MNILCIGHAAYDITLPVLDYPIENKKIRLKIPHIECGGGPAATAAYLLASWGIPTSFAGVIGEDYYGEKIREEFQKIGVSTKYLEANKKFKTTSSYIIANQKNGTRTIITSRDPKMEFEKITKITDNFDYILVDGDEFLLSYKTLKEKDKNTITMIDAGKYNENIVTLSKMVDYVVCSNDFARDYTKLPLDYQDMNTIYKVYDKLENDFKGQVIITLEKYGSFTKVDGKYHSIPSLKVKTVDSTGAGDIYHGALLYFISQDFPLLKAMYLANVTSALSVTKFGTRFSIPTLKEVLAYDK